MKKFGTKIATRNRAFREILTTERVYVDQLNSIVKNYLMSIREASKKKYVFSGVFRTIFFNDNLFPSKKTTTIFLIIINSTKTFLKQFPLKFPFF